MPTITPETSATVNTTAVSPDVSVSSPAQPLALDSTPDTAANEGTDDPDRSGFWSVFSSTFLTIFLAEIGDKTQITTLLMSAESHAPWVVFAGAGSALILTSLLGVLLGQWLAHRIEPQTLDRAAGLTLLGITFWLLLDVWQG